MQAESAIGLKEDADKARFDALKSEINLVTILDHTKDRISESTDLQLGDLLPAVRQHALQLTGS